MKQFIFLFIYAPEVKGGGKTTEAPKTEVPKTEAPVVQIAPEPTSAKLTEIRGKQSEAFAKLQGTKYQSDEYKAAKKELWQLDNDEAAEIANIKKAEADAKIAEARNARIKLVDDYDKATGDAKVAAREILVNELLARFATSSPAKKSGDGTAKVAGGSKTEEIFKLMDGGATYDSLIAAGYADGTIRSAAWKGGYKKGAGGTYVKGKK